ncbi:carbohydrate ABC transporter permease [Cellulomonas citrea]|uniref:carbohydrate ABC transporter permease n=1 Tax=Cellulomonas citrea TaxID=1909423 RepID=UPI001359D9E9|nr:sugar ABC transporter permease [Cellulomonas citrea]
MTTTTPAIGSIVPGAAGAGRSTSGSPRRRAAWAGLAFIVPGFALYALVIAYPAVQALLISLRDYKITPGAISPWIGLDNYVRALHDPVLLRSFVNAAVYMVATVPTQIVIGLGLAVLLNTALPGRTLFRVLFYLPVVTSWVVVSLLFQYLFATDNGIVNYLLVDVLGVLNQPVDWLGQRWTAMVAISALGIWKGVGWSMLIFLAALTGVPRELEEAAALDGAGAWRRFRHVSLPHIRGAMTTVVILLVIGGFNVFTSVLLMTDGGPLDQTQVPLTYMYRQAFGYLDFGYGSAISFLLTGLVLVISGLQYWWARRATRDGAA